jgi:hypothetical protein
VFGHTVAVDVVKAPGWAGAAPLIAILVVCAVLVPHTFTADTLSVPAVALAAKSIVKEFVLPLIVAPVPL